MRGYGYAVLDMCQCEHSKFRPMCECGYVCELPNCAMKEANRGEYYNNDDGKEFENFIVTHNNGLPDAIDKELTKRRIVKVNELGDYL